MLTFLSCGKKGDSTTGSIDDMNFETSIDPSVSYMSYVDNKISTYVKSDAFQKENLDDRVLGMKDIMDSLLKDNYLQGYKVYDKSDNPRVEYTYAGGGIGCTFLSEFKKNQN